MAHTMRIGDKVKHGGGVIERKRDYWNQCGREPHKSGARKALDDAIAERGTITGILTADFVKGTSDGYEVLWDNGSTCKCMTHMVQRA